MTQEASGLVHRATQRFDVGAPAMGSFGSSDAIESLRLERALIKVRWFGVALGVYLTIEIDAGPGPHPPRFAAYASWVIIGCLVLGNVLLSMLVRGSVSTRTMRRIGIGAFAMDTGLVLGSVWAFSYSPLDRTWVVLFLLPLEGALRYRLRGALGALGITVVSELAREAYLVVRFPASVSVATDLAFRIGIAAIVAFVAGAMAESLAREAGRYARAAEREARMRSEVAAFNDVILAGVAASHEEGSVQSMAERIGEELGFDVCAILLLDGDELIVEGTYGLPEEVRGQRFLPGEGAIAQVPAARQAPLVGDALRSSAFLGDRTDLRAEFATPLAVRGSALGALHVGKLEEAPIPAATLELLSRLADQISLVVLSTRLQRERDRAAQELRRSYEALQWGDEVRRGLLSHLVRAQEEERERIAGDIHDDPIQKLVALRMRLELMQERSATEDRPEIAKLRETVERAIAGLRHLIFELRPAVLDDEGLASALRHALAELGDEVDIALHDRLTTEPASVARLILYRIAQEALANVRKHAKASRVEVTVEEQGDGYGVRVADDGVGIGPHQLTTALGHIGLASIRERAEMAGGWCRVHSTPGSGTVVEFWIPASPTSSGSALPRAV